MLLYILEKKYIKDIKSWCSLYIKRRCKMKKFSLLAALTLFLSFGLVSCSSKKSEHTQEPVEAVEEEVVEVETSTSVASEQTEATNATTEPAAQ
jgi:hypothetical protein